MNNSYRSDTCFPFLKRLFWLNCLWPVRGTSLVGRRKYDTKCITGLNFICDASKGEQFDTARVYPDGYSGRSFFWPPAIWHSSRNREKSFLTAIDFEKCRPRETNTRRWHLDVVNYYYSAESWVTNIPTLYTFRLQAITDIYTVYRKALSEVGLTRFFMCF